MFQPLRGVCPGCRSGRRGIPDRAYLRFVSVCYDIQALGNNQGFFDINGKKVIDLYEYNIWPPGFHNNCVVFSDGYCLLSLRNDQRSEFFTIIDKTGKMMFEPLPGGLTYDDHIKCGMFIKRTGYNPTSDRGNIVYNTLGQAVASFPDGVRVSDFNDDVAMVTSNRHGVYYIDKTGKQITLDGSSTPASPSGVKVTLNGAEIKFDDQPPIIENGRTLVPLRAIFEALGASIDWNPSTKTVTATKSSTTITLSIGSNIMTVNGKNITLDVPAQIKNGRTLVPTRAVAEAFGIKVGWNQETQTVILTS